MPRFRPYDLLMLGLSTYVLAALAAGVALPLSPATRAVLRHVDTAICAVFLADFFVRLARARDRAAFLKWGWIDLVSSIPVLDSWRIGRIAHAVRVVRVLRGAGSLRRIAAILLRSRAEAALSAVTLVCLLLMVFASVAVLELEAGREGANIRTPSDALWWAAATVTTVGYGDRYPVTLEGRIIAGFLMTTGIACFVTFTAAVTTWFLAPAHDRAQELAQIRRQLDTVQQTLETLRDGRDPGPAAAAPHPPRRRMPIRNHRASSST